MTKKILLIEDNNDWRNIFKSKLAENGHSVLTAEDGQSGLKLAEKEKPDLLILDLMMPILDGKSFLNAIKKIKTLRNIPVIIVSNIADPEIKIGSEGVNDYLIKTNTSPEQLLKSVNRALEKT
ncbi:response regulator [Candidatus Parcubacteria bacterium]|nr:MAG: response regulator [Candidatus Parcubacteria bacterium]